MKTIKIVILCFILSLSFNAYSENEDYSETNLRLVESNLKGTEKWKNYFEKFNEILSKYENNKEVLFKLRDRITDLKTKVKSDSYSIDIKNLVSYMDLFINITINNNFPIIEENDSENTNDIEEDNSESTNNVEEDEPIVYPWFVEDYDDVNKSIIAWDDYIIFSWKTSAYYESVEVWTVTFDIEWVDIEGLKYSIQNAYLYLEWKLIDTISQSNIKIINSGKVVLTFNDLDDFIVPQKEINFRLWISVNPIWYEKIWKNVKDAFVKKVTFSDSVGVTSGNNINSFETNVSSETFSIVAWTPFVTKINDLTTSPFVKFNIKWLFWDNTVDDNNSAPKLLLKKLRFNYYDNTGDAVFKLVNSDDSSDFITWTKNNWILEFDLNSMASNNKTIWNWAGEDFRILVSNTNSSISLELLKNWILYDVLWVSGGTDFNSNFSSTIDFWTRDF